MCYSLSPTQPLSVNSPVFGVADTLCLRKWSADQLFMIFHSGSRQVIFVPPIYGNGLAQWAKGYMDVCLCTHAYLFCLLQTVIKHFIGDVVILSWRPKQNSMRPIFSGCGHPSVCGLKCGWTQTGCECDYPAMTGALVVFTGMWADPTWEPPARLCLLPCRTLI